MSRQQHFTLGICSQQGRVNQCSPDPHVYNNLSIYYTHVYEIDPNKL